MAAKLSIFFAELKRRKVYRVAVVYVVVGLGILGAAEVTLDPLGLEALRPYIVILVLLGFPIALVLAWAYEVKPEEPRETPVAGIDTSEAEGRKSIVVLPFDNMSPDPNDAYFADGLTEEIITDLSHMHTLRVISRSSATVLKGTQKDVQTIGRELDVQYVLEGSVRKAGDDLRITAQLIDASADEHLWAEKYSGRLDDIFEMQEKVARSIVEALQLQLDPEEERRLSERPIENLQAYECYLRALADFWAATEETLDRALRLLERGLEIVGENDLLLAAKGLIHFSHVNSLNKAPETYGALLEQAQQWATRALEINPTSAPAHTLQGSIFASTGNPSGSLHHYKTSLQLDPNTPLALLMVGYWHAAGGLDLGVARHFLERLQAVDPLTPLNEGAMGWLHWFTGDYAAALEGWKGWQSVLENASSPYRTFLAYLHAAAGDMEEAVRLVDQSRRDVPDHLMTSLGCFLKHAWLGEKQQALEAVTEDLEKGAWWDDMWPLLLAGGHALIGETERAYFWLDHAVDFGITNVQYLREFDPFLVGLRTDDRFSELMEKAASLSESNPAAINIEEII